MWSFWFCSSCSISLVGSRPSCRTSKRSLLLLKMKDVCLLSPLVPVLHSGGEISLDENPVKVAKKACADVTASKNALTSRFTRTDSGVWKPAEDVKMKMKVILPEYWWRGCRCFRWSLLLLISSIHLLCLSLCISPPFLSSLPPSASTPSFVAPLQRQGTSGDAFIKQKHWFVLTVFVRGLGFFHQMKIPQSCSDFSPSRCWNLEDLDLLDLDLLRYLDRKKRNNGRSRSVFI